MWLLQRNLGFLSITTSYFSSGWTLRDGATVWNWNSTRGGGSFCCCEKGFSLSSPLWVCVKVARKGSFGTNATTSMPVISHQASPKNRNALLQRRLYIITRTWPWPEQKRLSHRLPPTVQSRSVKWKPHIHVVIDDVLIVWCGEMLEQTNLAWPKETTEPFVVWVGTGGKSNDPCRYRATQKNVENLLLT